MLRLSFHSATSSRWTPLGRGSHGPVSRQTITQERFGTHRAFTHALPPSLSLRSVPCTVPPCFSPLPLKWRKKQVGNGRKGKNMKLEEVNTRTKEAVDFLVAALESGHSEVLTAYLVTDLVESKVD